MVKKKIARRNPFTRVLVGNYRLGFENVDLFISSEEGGSFALAPNPGKTGMIDIGIKSAWNEIMPIFLHESFEYYMARFHHRYEPSEQIYGDHGDYIFQFNHPEFSRMCAAIGIFTSECMNPLYRAYKKNKPKP